MIRLIFMIKQSRQQKVNGGSVKSYEYKDDLGTPYSCRAKILRPP